MFGISAAHLLLVAAIVLIVMWFAWLTRTRRIGPRRDARRDDALEILRKRYARGEISEAEFEQKRRFLGG